MPKSNDKIIIEGIEGINLSTDTPLPKGLKWREAHAKTGELKISAQTEIDINDFKQWFGALKLKGVSLEKIEIRVSKKGQPLKWKPSKGKAVAEDELARALRLALHEVQTKATSLQIGTSINNSQTLETSPLTSPTLQKPAVDLSTKTQANTEFSTLKVSLPIEASTNTGSQTPATSSQEEALASTAFQKPAASSLTETPASTDSQTVKVSSRIKIPANTTPKTPATSPQEEALASTTFQTPAVDLPTKTQANTESSTLKVSLPIEASTNTVTPEIIPQIATSIEINPPIPKISSQEEKASTAPKTASADSSTETKTAPSKLEASSPIEVPANNVPQTPEADLQITTAKANKQEEIKATLRDKINGKITTLETARKNLSFLGQLGQFISQNPLSKQIERQKQLLKLLDSGIKEAEVVALQTKIEAFDMSRSFFTYFFTEARTKLDKEINASFTKTQPESNLSSSPELALNSNNRASEFNSSPPKESTANIFTRLNSSNNDSTSLTNQEVTANHDPLKTDPFISGNGIIESAMQPERNVIENTEEISPKDSMIQPILNRESSKTPIASPTENSQTQDLEPVKELSSTSLPLGLKSAIQGGIKFKNRPVDTTNATLETKETKTLSRPHLNAIHQGLKLKKTEPFALSASAEPAKPKATGNLMADIRNSKSLKDSRIPRANGNTAPLDKRNQQKINTDPLVNLQTVTVCTHNEGFLTIIQNVLGGQASKIKKGAGYEFSYPWTATTADEATKQFNSLLTALKVENHPERFFPGLFTFRKYDSSFQKMIKGESLSILVQSTPDRLSKFKTLLDEEQIVYKLDGKTFTLNKDWFVNGSKLLTKLVEANFFKEELTLAKGSLTQLPEAVKFNLKMPAERKTAFITLFHAQGFKRSFVSDDLLFIHPEETETFNKFLPTLDKENFWAFYFETDSSAFKKTIQSGLRSPFEITFGNTKQIEDFLRANLSLTPQEKAQKTYYFSPVDMSTFLNTSSKDSKKELITILATEPADAIVLDPGDDKLLKQFLQDIHSERKKLNAIKLSEILGGKPSTPKTNKPKTLAEQNTSPLKADDIERIKTALENILIAESSAVKLTYSNKNQRLDQAIAKLKDEKLFPQTLAYTEQFIISKATFNDLQTRSAQQAEMEEIKNLALKDTELSIIPDAGSIEEAKFITALVSIAKKRDFALSKLTFSENYGFDQALFEKIKEKSLTVKEKIDLFLQQYKLKPNGVINQHVLTISIGTNEAEFLQGLKTIFDDNKESIPDKEAFLTTHYPFSAQFLNSIIAGNLLPNSTQLNSSQQGITKPPLGFLKDINARGKEESVAPPSTNNALLSQIQLGNKLKSSQEPAQTTLFDAIKKGQQLKSTKEYQHSNDPTSLAGKMKERRRRIKGETLNEDNDQILLVVLKKDPNKYTLPEMERLLAGKSAYILHEESIYYINNEQFKDTDMGQFVNCTAYPRLYQTDLASIKKLFQDTPVNASEDDLRCLKKTLKEERPSEAIAPAIKDSAKSTANDHLVPATSLSSTLAKQMLNRIKTSTLTILILSSIENKKQGCEYAFNTDKNTLIRCADSQVIPLPEDFLIELANAAEGALEYDSDTFTIEKVKLDKAIKELASTPPDLSASKETKDTKFPSFK